jgi:hypothetical protein
MKCDVCFSTEHANHAYSSRYAMTNFGPVSIRTKHPISAAEAKRIIAGTVLRLGRDEGTPKFKHWMTFLDTIPWPGLCTIYDEAQT